MTVAQILRTKGSEVITAEGKDTILQVLKVMKERRIGAVLIMADGGKIAGVLSERDIVRALPKAGGKLLDQPVSSLMTRDVITCTPEMSVEAVLELMTRHRFRHLPVMEGKKLVGLVSIGDAVKERINEAEHEAKALRSYIATG